MADARAAGAARPAWPQATIEALRVGARPKGLPADEEAALDFAVELLNTHGASEPTYLAAVARFGEQGVVELTTLVGYFVMVSWLMNVAHTPAQAAAQGEPPARVPALTPPKKTATLRWLCKVLGRTSLGDLKTLLLVVVTGFA